MDGKDRYLILRLVNLIMPLADAVMPRDEQRALCIESSPNEDSDRNPVDYLQVPTCYPH